MRQPAHLADPSSQPAVERPLNLCTSTMPAFDLDTCLTLAALNGYEGIELRVNDNYHISLADLYYRCDEVKRSVEAHGLQLRVYNTYFGVTDNSAIDALIRICQRTGVKYFRVTVPIAGNAAVRTEGADEAVVPSYIHRAQPPEILRGVRAHLQTLARKTRAAGVCALLEIHWGTVMSSFTSAHHLVGDLDPYAVAVTFDPANMIIEGKEDWDYGIQLLREHFANVHVKNASWEKQVDRWKWRWDGLQQGMVDWRRLLRLLNGVDYRGMFAMEDFRVPYDFNGAMTHLRESREEFQQLLQQSHSRQAA